MIQNFRPFYIQLSYNERHFISASLSLGEAKHAQEDNLRVLGYASLHSGYI